MCAARFIARRPFLLDQKRDFGSEPIVGDSHWSMPANTRTLDLMYRKRLVPKENVGEKRTIGKTYVTRTTFGVFDDYTRNDKH